MTAVALSFKDRTLRAAELFLQTALVVDDQLEMLPARLESTTPPATVSKDPTLEGLPPIHTPSLEEFAAAGRRGAIDAKLLVEAFAEHGIVCATLSPDGVGEKGRALRTAERADLVVLDWAIGDEKGGQAALTIVEHLVKAGGLRVIAIYTQEPSLRAIVEKLRSIGTPVDEGKDGKATRVRFGQVRVVVLAKPAAGIEHVDPDSVVTEADLPRRLLLEFSEAAGGLLSNAALRGLAAVRRATPLILGSLDRPIDPGYLAHRLLLDQPIDAEEHAVSLLANECAAILETAEVAAEVDIDAIKAWMDAQRMFDPDLAAERWNENFSKPDADKRNEALREVLRLGSKDPSVQERIGQLKSNPNRKVARLFSMDAQEGEESNDRFAHHMAVRPRYKAGLKRLGLGTVIDNGSTVFVSIQPGCDAVRLTAITAFPLVPLEERTTTKGPFSLVIQDGNRFRRFALPKKFSDLRLVEYKPGPAVEEIVERTTKGGSAFVDTKRRTYRWIADLREPVALRIAKEFSEQLSRLALDESEWLRRSAKDSGRPPDRPREAEA